MTKPKPASPLSAQPGFVCEVIAQRLFLAQGDQESCHYASLSLPFPMLVTLLGFGAQEEQR